MKKFLNKEVMTPLVVLLFLMIYLQQALTKQSAPFVDGVPQETFFPILIVIVGVIASLTLLIPALIKTAGSVDDAAEKAPIQKKPIYIIIAMALFIFLFGKLGYTLVAPFYVFFLMTLYDDGSKSIAKRVIFTLIIVALVYVLYTFIFDINFPEIWR
jgi:hypothetical protein